MNSFQECVQRIQEQGGITTFQFKLQDERTGETTFHHVTAFVMQDDEQASYWFFSKDITEVIKSRDKYREVNRLLDAILNNVPVYLYVKDTGNDFRYIGTRLLPSFPKFLPVMFWVKPTLRCSPM